MTLDNSESAVFRLFVGIDSVVGPKGDRGGDRRSCRRRRGLKQMDGPLYI